MMRTKALLILTVVAVLLITASCNNTPIPPKETDPPTGHVTDPPVTEPESGETAAPDTGDTETSVTPPENTPVSVISELIEADRKAEGEITVIRAAFNCPVIETGSDYAGVDAVNLDIHKLATDFLAKSDDYIDVALDEFGISQSDGMEFSPYILSGGYTVSYNSTGILSIIFNTDISIGGAHSGHDVITRTYNLSSGSLLNLRQITGASENDIKALAVTAFTELINLNPSDYFDNAIQTLDSAVDISHFVLSEEGVRFFIDEYIIAPYATGSPEVLIPLDRF